ncbi:MAG TPA: DEAD/DEAH box helicase [Blastocatellia bacterium]|nr:DEAD/DEAH box helicase [Blastocatellia bacterium]
MSLTVKFSSLIDSAVRSRGRSYFSQGLVRITHGDESLVEATVRGTRNYRVMLSIEGNNFTVSCTCPYYAGGDICKHIWATMLAAESRGYLFGPDYEPKRLRMGDQDDDDDDYDDDDDDYYDEDDYHDDDDEPEARMIRSSVASPASSARPQSNPSGWRQQFAHVSRAMENSATQRAEAWSTGRELFYVVDAPLTMTGNGLTVEVGYRERKQNGEWSKLKTQGITSKVVSGLPDPSDRQIVALLVGAKDQTSYGYTAYEPGATRFRLFHPIEQTLIPLMCRTGRCRLRMEKDGEMSALAWDDRGAWDFWLEIRRGETGNQYVITGSLRRGDERRELSSPAMLTSGGLVFDHTLVSSLNDFGAFAWISLLRRQGALRVPLGQGDELLRELLTLPHLPRLDLPGELSFEEETLAPRLRLKLRQAEQGYWQSRPLRGELSFDYDGEVITDDDQRRGIFRADERRFLTRDLATEHAAEERLRQLGFRRSYSYGNHRSLLEVNSDKLPRIVRVLVGEGWHVEAEGKLYRQPGQINIQVTSGIDWFELHGAVEFGDSAASLPALLAALRRGDNVVQLGDGTFGLLPEEWLKKYAVLAGLGESEGDHLRFTRSQVGLLDALLASQPQAEFDATFASARDELQRFEGVKAVDPPQGFVGELRGYQKEGLGWLCFLQQFGFGGCLADDMGTGKTVQALALLESRREIRANGDQPGSKVSAKKKKSRKEGNGKKEAGGKAVRQAHASLVVVPKSLVFNWKQEAARFAPRLRVLDHTGQFRRKTVEHFDDYDLILTTYGTLRRDAVRFKDIEFDYVILDEAQAIKNADTASSKAARLLRAGHRLALSGTPVENHLGELWALFDFLNPGLLGAASVFKLAGTAARNPDEETRALLAKALRPFILRRTKEQVARDLPPKLEQTIYCEMEPVQRKLYDELRDHYRRSLLGLVESRGMQRSKIQILEALLRLRQAACHPGLIDKKRTGEPSAKLDVLLPQLAEVLDEGHKALVFSQFTSLLSIVRSRLDDEGIKYEYLDGRTRDRAGRVERFQNDADCKLFLVSLKAGGLGLNLTAAEYVFLLDPWWNPAVEAQAIDRAHRIGQTKNVFAYRLIARGTVEEKVLELQKTKRELADAIINADNSLIRTLGREDLELLLS